MALAKHLVFLIDFALKISTDLLLLIQHTTLVPDSILQMLLFEGLLATDLLKLREKAHFLILNSFELRSTRLRLLQQHEGLGLELRPFLSVSFN